MKNNMSNVNNVNNVNNVSGNNDNNTMTEIKCNVMMLPIASIKFADYQRPCNLSRAKKIAEEFSPDKVRPIEVSFRNGEYWCYDGAHRCRSMGWLGYKTIPAQVHYGLTYGDEAKLFATQHANESKISKRDEWNAMVAAGDRCSDIIVMKRVAGEFGYIINPNDFHRKNPHVIHSIWELQKCYSMFGEDGLRFVFFTISQLWGNDSKSVHREIIGGIVKIMSAYDWNDEYFRNRFFNKLNTISADKILQMANSYKGRGSKQVAFAIARVYNNGLKHNSKTKLDINKIK